MYAPHSHRVRPILRPSFPPRRHEQQPPHTTLSPCSETLGALDTERTFEIHIPQTLLIGPTSAEGAFTQDMSMIGLDCGESAGRFSMTTPPDIVSRSLSAGSDPGDSDGSRACHPCACLPSLSPPPFTALVLEATPGPLPPGVLDLRRLARASEPAERAERGASSRHCSGAPHSLPVPRTKILLL